MTLHILNTPLAVNEKIEKGLLVMEGERLIRYSLGRGYATLSKGWLEINSIRLYEKREEQTLPGV